MQAENEQPYTLPPGRWHLEQRWGEMLLAHWPLDPAIAEGVLPEGLVPDIYHGQIWLTMECLCRDQIRYAKLLPVPAISRIPEVNLLLTVRDAHSGEPAHLMLSKDIGCPIAALVTRFLFHMPSKWAEIYFERHPERSFSIVSRRHFSSTPAVFRARYRPTGALVLMQNLRPGTFEHFLVERYSLFVLSPGGMLLRHRVHHLPWRLEKAEAEIEENSLAAALGIDLPDRPSLLHYVDALAVHIERGVPAGSPAAGVLRPAVG